LLLPAETRKHRETSPFGTWDFCAATSPLTTATSPPALNVKLGLRWGMPVSSRHAQKKEVRHLAGHEANILPTAKG